MEWLERHTRRVTGGRRWSGITGGRDQRGRPMGVARWIELQEALPYVPEVIVDAPDEVNRR